MAVVSGTLAPAVAPAANAAAQGSGSAARGSEGSTMTSNAQNALASQSAAVVNLTPEGQSRAASSGDGRKVDGTFNKEESKGRPADTPEKESEEGKPSRLSISA